MVDIVILFFLLGIIAGLCKANIRLPSAIYELLSIILLIAIGLKGGLELSSQPFLSLVPDIIAVTLFGFLLPLLVYPVLKHLGRFSRADAASIAAHYGSVSVGTFAVVLAFLDSRDVFYEKHVSLFVVILEIPAIIVGILLAKGVQKNTDWKKMFHEIFFGRSLVLLLGALLIAWIAGEEQTQSISPFFFDLFKGVLALFLLEMGLVTASQIGSLKKYGLFLIFFGVLTPLLFAILGIGLGHTIGLSVGGTTILGTLAASASYIAVPAAMRISVPESNPTLSLTASLGITFPFNVILGIPAYHYLAQHLNVFLKGL